MCETPWPLEAPPCWGALKGRESFTMFLVPHLDYSCHEFIHRPTLTLSLSLSFFLQVKGACQAPRPIGPPSVPGLSGRVYTYQLTYRGGSLSLSLSLSLFISSLGSGGCWTTRRSIKSRDLKVAPSCRSVQQSILTSCLHPAALRAPGRCKQSVQQAPCKT